MRPRGTGLAILVVLLVLLVAGYLRTRDADKSPEQQQQAGATGVDDLDALRDLERTVARLQNLTKGQRAPARVLDLVSQVLPDLVWLERLSLRKKNVTIAGRASGTRAIADFLEALGEVRGFGEPETRSITAAGRGHRFSLAFAFDPDALVTTAADGELPPEPAARSGDPALSTEDLRARIGELEARLERLLPGARQTDELRRHIRALARQDGVALLRFRPREIIDGHLHRRWPIDISVETPYHGLVSFLDQIGRSGLVVPGDLDVRATPGESGITATLVLTAYLKPQSESEAPPG